MALSTRQFAPAELNPFSLCVPAASNATSLFELAPLNRSSLFELAPLNRLSLDVTAASRKRKMCFLKKETVASKKIKAAEADSNVRQENSTRRKSEQSWSIDPLPATSALRNRTAANTKILIPQLYRIPFGAKLYAKVDSSGWLTTTNDVTEATLFQDVRPDSETGEMVVKVASGSWYGKFLGSRWFTRCVGAYSLEDSDSMRWYRGRLIQSEGPTVDHDLVCRRSNGYLYFQKSAAVGSSKESMLMTGPEKVKLGSMVSVYQLQFHKDVGSITKEKAMERYKQRQVAVGVYEPRLVTVYRATDIPWDWKAIESGKLVSKYMHQSAVAERTRRSHTSKKKIGPIVTPRMVADPHNMDVLGMRILAMGSSDEPCSQFVSVACSFEVASRFGQRVYSFKVRPNGPRLAKGGECQYQILGGTEITNVKLLRK